MSIPKPEATCPYAHWRTLPPSLRSRLRVLPAYTFKSQRLAHLSDTQRCAACRHEQRSAA